VLEFDLSKQFGKGKTGFLLDVKGQFPTGKIIGIYGPSGAGKSSLLRLLSGLEKPDEGYFKIKDAAESNSGLHWREHSYDVQLYSYSMSRWPHWTKKFVLLYKIISWHSTNNFSPLPY